MCTSDSEVDLQEPQDEFYMKPPPGGPIQIKACGLERGTGVTAFFVFGI